MGSSRRGRGEGWQMVKSVAIWTVLLIGSFAFGLFVISPLINVASGANADTQRKPQPSATQTAAPAPEPVRQSAQATVTPPVRSSGRDTDPEIRLGPEDSPTIQSPDSLEPTQDSGRPKRRRHNPQTSEEKIQSPDSAGPDKPPGETVSAENPDSTSGVAVTEQTAQEPSRRPRRRHARSSEQRTTQAQTPRRRRSAEGRDSGKSGSSEKTIQRSEPIDN